MGIYIKQGGVRAKSRPNADKKGENTQYTQEYSTQQETTTDSVGGEIMAEAVALKAHALQQQQLPPPQLPLSQQHELSCLRPLPYPTHIPREGFITMEKQSRCRETNQKSRNKIDVEK